MTAGTVAGADSSPPEAARAPEAADPADAGVTGATSDIPLRAVPSGRSLFRGASWMSVTHLVAQTFAYGSLLVLARLVAPASFGTVAVGTSFVWFAVAVVGSGTGGAIVTAQVLTSSFLRRALRRSLVIAILLSGLIAVAAGLLTSGFAKGGSAVVLIALAASLPLYALSLIPTAVLQRAMEFGKLARATAAANIGSAGVAVGAGLAGAGVWALVARQLLWFALLALFAGISVRPFLPPRRPTTVAAGADVTAGPVRDRWFLLFGLTLFLALNIDYLILGTVRNVHSVGLYALAFMIAFAPVEHFSAEVGKVLFAAAAASGVEGSGARTLRAVHAMSILLLPIVPVAIVLAPAVLPAVLGKPWASMVVPFQILIVVGVAQAIANCVGEALSGVGQIAFRTKVNLAWCGALLFTLLIFVTLDGARGAALAHLVVFVPYAFVYATIGARRVGTSGSELWQAMRRAVVAVGLQAAATAALTLGLRASGVSYGIAATVGALGGIVLFVGVVVGRGGVGGLVAMFEESTLDTGAAVLHGVGARLSDEGRRS
jgi:O-antigen/teichoic acid export membrane protein